MNVAFQIPARGPGLPLSIPYRRDTQVEILIERHDNDPPGPVAIDILHTSGLNGIASLVTGEELLASGHVIIRGAHQTMPNNSGLIQVRARFNGQEFLSDGFSVCAHPAAVKNGPECSAHVYVRVSIDPLNAGQELGQEHLVGMFIRLGIVSDSGDDNDLNEVVDQELLSEPRDHSASMQGNPHGHSQTAKSQRASEATLDLHDSALSTVLQYARALQGRVGWWANDQLDTFVCQRCGMTEPAVIPNSGYRLIRSIARSLGNRIRFRVAGADGMYCEGCRHGGGTRVSPGPSPPHGIKSISNVSMFLLTMRHSLAWEDNSDRHSASYRSRFSAQAGVVGQRA